MLQDWRAFLTERLLAPENLWSLGQRILIAVLIVVGAQLLIRFLYLVTDRAFSFKLRGEPDDLEQKQRETLKGIARSIVRYTINFAAALTVLSHFDIDTTQFLAGAGILGLAIGFGAQSLVKDFLSGFFILYEHQFAVGDYVEIAGVAGIVHGMGLRSTVVRDFGGQYHYVPNGTIGTVTNYNRGEMRILIQVEVAYEENLDRVLEVLDEACRELAEESEEVVDGPRPLGVAELGSSGIVINLWGLARPGSQWALSRDLRLKVKKALDREGIEIPYPRRVVVPASLTSVGRGEEE